MATAEDELLLPRLPELFETSKQLLDEVEVATEPTGSRIIQDKVLKGLDLLKKAAEMLSELDLFSRNEDLEEIVSSDLKYLMVPAFQGAFAMKQVNPSKRLDNLQWARERFLNYLTQCQYYHVAEFELPKTKTNSTENNTANSSMAYPSLVAMASQRQAKIERYKQKKEVENRLSAMKSAVESGQADDEHVHEYYLLHLRRWIGISLEEIESIDQEIKILRGEDSSKESSEQLSNKIRNRRKRMMNRQSTELGSGMTGTTPILWAMATDRTWVSLPTARQDYRGFCLPHQGKLCSLPLPGLLLQPCTTKAEMLNLALHSLKCQTIKCVFLP
ncbi:immunoglobulin-binding protein 1-like isoform X3 [Tursiops truncatus]|uniref:immunoglobulin-binding protein 1-like isoform X3 n=1 Tax=Tursiops truncatus TaxID=9739 RepID=UPI001457D938|nr:immunoglobulin-binding protein 1-like isoform X2 [Tursiops truncatus]